MKFIFKWWVMNIMPLKWTPCFSKHLCEYIPKPINFLFSLLSFDEEKNMGWNPGKIRKEISKCWNLHFKYVFKCTFKIRFQMYISNTVSNVHFKCGTEEKGQTKIIKKLKSHGVKTVHLSDSNLHTWLIISLRCSLVFWPSASTEWGKDEDQEFHELF